MKLQQVAPLKRTTNASSDSDLSLAFICRCVEESEEPYRHDVVRCVRALDNFAGHINEERVFVPSQK